MSASTLTLGSDASDVATMDTSSLKMKKDVGMTLCQKLVKQEGE